MFILAYADHSFSDREKARSWMAKLQDWGYSTVIIGNLSPGAMIVDEEARAAGMNVSQSPAVVLPSRPSLVVVFRHPTLHASSVDRGINYAKLHHIDMIVAY